jgi:cyclopropane fatty-acyl-phospholipid synthase-like methyltransferase
MTFNVPLSQQKAERLIAALRLPALAQVVDLGCGQGDFLLDVVRTCTARGLGLDLNAESIAKARQMASWSNSNAQFQQVDLRSERLPAAEFDLAICLGSTHAFADGKDAYSEALQAMYAAVRPGGQLLLGEGFWEKDPHPDYLALLGEPVGIYNDHHQNIQQAEALGLVTHYVLTSSLDEWDHFEWTHQQDSEAQVAAQPDDPDHQDWLAQRRTWMDGYLRWGRGTMGFGFYLFRKPLALNVPR